MPANTILTFTMRVSVKSVFTTQNPDAAVLCPNKWALQYKH